MAKFSTTIFKFLSEAYIQYKKVYFWILTGLSSVASRSYLENDFEMLKKEYFNIIAQYLMPQAMHSFSYYFIQLPWKGKTKNVTFFSFLLLSVFSRENKESVRIYHVTPASTRCNTKSFVREDIEYHQKNILSQN